MSRFYNGLLDTPPYCALFDFPSKWYSKADMWLAVTLVSNSIWMAYIHDALSLIGLAVGTFIGCVRAYKIIRGRADVKPSVDR